MVGPASAGTADTIGQRLKNISMRSTPHVHISLDAAHDDFVATFSTMDKIEGKVTVTYPADTLVKSLDINFNGKTKTFVERLTSSTAISGRQEASHQFLKLAQPIPRSAMPENMLFKANTTYTFDFLFVVPPQLLPRVCRHAVVGNNVHQEHINLPPSVGDKNISGRGRTLLDDFAPDMARISYMVTASVQDASVDGGSPPTPTVRNKGVRIIPAVDEKAPLSADGPDSDYTLRNETDIRKGVFKGKMGRMVMEASQPKAIQVAASGIDQHTPESTVVTVKLRFDPIDSKTLPPKLGNLASKIKVSTFFSSAARARLPSKHDIQWDVAQGMHSETLALASRNVGAAEWHEHDGRESSPPLFDDIDVQWARRNSAASGLSALSNVSSLPEPSKKYTPGRRFFTAQVVVPITLPSNKAWLPTFHTCLISRIYSLNLHLGLPGTASLDLKLPVQIGTVGGDAAVTAARRRQSSLVAMHGLSAEEMELEAAEANDFFAPRTITPMDPGYVGGSNIRGTTPSDLPPSYDDFPRHGSRVAVAV